MKQIVGPLIMRNRFEFTSQRGMGRPEPAPTRNLTKPSFRMKAPLSKIDGNSTDQNRRLLKFTTNGALIEFNPSDTFPGKNIKPLGKHEHVRTLGLLVRLLNKPRHMMRHSQFRNLTRPKSQQSAQLYSLHLFGIETRSTINFKTQTP